MWVAGTHKQQGGPTERRCVRHKAFTSSDRRRCSVGRQQLYHTLLCLADIDQNVPPITSTTGEKYVVYGGPHTPTPKQLHIYSHYSFQVPVGMKRTAPHPRPVSPLYSSVIYRSLASLILAAGQIYMRTALRTKRKM
jgi:hypothetical protein